MEIAKCPVCGEPGTIHLRWQRCGKPNCKCARGELHGPYPEVNHAVGWHIDQNGKGVCDDYRCYVSKKALAAKENARIRFLIATLARSKSIKEHVSRRRKKGRPYLIGETLAKPRSVAGTGIVKKTHESSGWGQAREQLREQASKAMVPQPEPEPLPLAKPQPAPAAEKPVVQEPSKKPCPYANVVANVIPRFCSLFAPSGRCPGVQEYICTYEPVKKPVKPIVVKLPCPEYGSNYCRRFEQAGWCPQTDFYRCRSPKITL